MAGSTSAVPLVIDALVAGASDLYGADQLNVYDGFGNSEDPGDFLMIGVEDPELDGFGSSATANQTWAAIGAQRREQRGTVTCAALSWNRDNDPRAARAAAYATVAALEDYLRAHPDLGLVPFQLSLLMVGAGESEQLQQAQSADGAAALVVFTVQYLARI